MYVCIRLIAAYFNFVEGAAVQPLPWDIRLRILIGAARGLAFLHASDRKVIYRDFKASNILLDGVIKFIILYIYIFIAHVYILLMMFFLLQSPVSVVPC